MRIFNMGSARKKTGSHLALAIALATGTAVIGSTAFADTAYAQDKKKKKKKKEEKAQYSEEFVAAYTPLNTSVNEEGADVAALKPQLVSLAALSVSPDEQIAAGGLIYNAGAKTSDRSLQIQGMELMLSSGKVEAANVGRFNFIAYQLRNAESQFAEARPYLQAAIDNNFVTDTVTKADLQIAMAESFFSEERYREGLSYLDNAIANKKAAGEAVDEQWYRRGLTVAYNNEIVPEVYDIATAWIADYPSETSWRDAINLTRNLSDYQGAEMLDLMRLGHRVKSLQNKQDYIEYIEAADARLLPKEVSDLIEEGYASGVVSRDDIYVADSLQIAKGRVASDRSDLPALERDARAAGAGLRTVKAAGDTFLSYGEHAKAAEFFQKTLGMPGVDTAETLTRLGIAQAGMGQYDAAKESFAKVEGPRKPIAQLWAAYAGQKSSPATPAAATAAPADTLEAPATGG